MPDQDIFDDNKVTDKPADDSTEKPVVNEEGAPNAVDQLLKDIKRDDGTQKYATAEEAIKAGAEAQGHITKLESELAELREKGNASDKLDELLDAVKSKGSGQGDEKTVSTMKPEDVLGIVQDYIKDSKAAETRDDNIKSVTSVYKDRYGKDASDKLYGKAADLGFSVEEINRMIATNPNAALKVLGEDAPKKSVTDPVSGGGVDTSQFQGKPAEAPTSIMGSTKSSELVDAWKASKQRTLERLGYDK